MTISWLILDDREFMSVGENRKTPYKRTHSGHGTSQHVALVGIPERISGFVVKLSLKYCGPPLAKRGKSISQPSAISLGLSAKNVIELPQSRKLPNSYVLKPVNVT